MTDKHPIHEEKVGICLKGIFAYYNHIFTAR